MTALISFAIFVLIPIAGIIGQLPDSKSEGSIAGRVTVDGEAVAGVEIGLQPASEMMRLPLPDPIAKVSTDKEGRFRLRNVAPGRYYLTMLTTAYFLTSPLDSRIPQSRLVILAKGEQISEINLSLKRGGAVHGQVRTKDGDPAAGRDIVLIHVESPEKTHKIPMDYGSGYKTVTDENGIFHVEQLPAGPYHLCVLTESDLSPKRWMFYPGVRDRAEARLIEVLPGQTTANIDLTLPPRPHTYEVHGRVIDAATGEPLAHTRVSWRSNSSANQNGIFIGGSGTNDLGEFHFKGVLPGQYKALILIDSGSELISDPIPFEITDHNVNGLEIRAQKGGRLSGKILVEGSATTTKPSDFSGLSIQIYPMTGGMGMNVEPALDGRFSIAGLPSNKYRLSIQTRNGPQFYSLIRIEQNGIELNDGIDAFVGKSVEDLNLIVTYGTGIVRGEVEIVNGPLPEGAQLSVAARRVDVSRKLVPGILYPVDTRRRFALTGLASGEHEIHLEVFIPPNFSLGVNEPRWKTQTQRVVVKSGTESQIMIVFDAATLQKK